MFDIDLPSTTLDGCNTVDSVDWLSRDRADTPVRRKLCGESLFVLKRQSGAKVSAISAMKARSVYGGATLLY